MRVKKTKKTLKEVEKEKQEKIHGAAQYPDEHILPFLCDSHYIFVMFSKWNKIQTH